MSVNNTNVNSNINIQNHTNEKIANHQHNSEPHSYLHNKNKEFKKNTTAPSFKVLLWNCNRLVNKITLLNDLLRVEKPDIIAISELKCNHAEARYYLPLVTQSNECDYEYAFTARNKNPEFGGGSALLVKKGIDKIDIDLSQFEGEEICGKIIKIKGNPTAIFSWYNPPGKQLSGALLRYIESKYQNFLILGDLNAHFEPYSERVSLNTSGEILADFIESSNASIINDSHSITSYWTSDTKSSHSIIDFIIGSNSFLQKLREYKALKYSNLDAYQNKHYYVPVVATFNMSKTEKTIRNAKNDSYNFAKANWAMYRSSQEENCEEMLLENDAERLKNKVEEQIINAANKAIPKIVKTSRISNLPEYLVVLIKTKNYWRRRYYRTRTLPIKDIYYSLKELVNQEVYKFNNEKMKKFIQGLGPRPLSTKPLWKRIKRMHNQSQTEEIPTLIKNGKEYSTNDEKARVFGERMAETLNEQPEARAKFDQKHYDFINDYVSNKRYEEEYSESDKEIKLVKPVDVRKALSRLNSKTSTDQQGISNKLLKNLPKRCMKSSQICLTSV